MNPILANDHGATDVAAATAPNTEANEVSVPANGNGHKCQMPQCANPIDGNGIHCAAHQPGLFTSSWQERLDKFPAELREKDIWCVWVPELREGKLTKRPLASSTDSNTWMSFEQACTVADRNERYGVGVMADGFHSFADLDKCIVNGEIEPWAQAVLLRTNSYAELSPSGTGLHIFLRGTVSKAAKINGCEIYSKARFFTVTGQHIPTTPLTIAEPTSDELEELRQDIADGVLRPKAAVADTGRGRLIVAERYLTQAERETRLERALALDLGDYNGDRSAAVYGALQLLARKHGGDEEAMLEEFEASPLCADWGGKWERLKENETAKAIANWKENGSPKWEDDGRPERPWVLKRFSQMEAKPVNWIWPGYLAAGKLTTISGEPGHGKSMIALDIAARVTTGKDFPDGSKNTLAPYEVLLLTVEEDHEDTVLPRFLLAGGDPAKLIALYLGDRPGLFSLEESSKQLRQLFTENPQIRLLILDPMLDFVRADQNKDADVRAALNGLADIASEFGFAVVGINHFNKKSDMDAIHRVAGSRGWTAVARINHIVGRTEDGVRHLCNLKTNIAKEGSSLDFNIEQRPLRAGKIEDVEYPYVSWIGKGSATANDITMSQRPRESKVSPVEEWLKELLADGEWHSSTDIHDAGDDRFSKDSIKRALNRVRAQYEKRGMPAKGYWRASEVRDSQRISETEVRL